MPRKTTSHLAKAATFFAKHAGVGYDPATETRAQGAKRGGMELAKAEQYAFDHDWSVDWEEDSEPYQMGDAETDVPREVLCAVLRDAEGNVLASLCGIGDPDRNYRRVVEAELALEAMP